MNVKQLGKQYAENYRKVAYIARARFGVSDGHVAEYKLSPPAGKAGAEWTKLSGRFDDLDVAVDAGIRAAREAIDEWLLSQGA